ncbi:MAG TPA: hypothetical protein VFC19_45015 [Candidatus Limnocylindrales bacterium]|nr:hypothetical protein [Candidatus Limnocylindrales bacterium]
MALHENSPRDWDADLAKLLNNQTQQGNGSGNGPAGSHFDVALDEIPTAGGMPVEPLETVAPQQRDVIPMVLRSWKVFKAEAYQTIRAGAHVGAFHAMRLPWYGLQTGWYALIGAGKLVGRQIRWWWLDEVHLLRQNAANADDPHTWLKLHREGKATRAFRGLVLLGQAAALTIGAIVAPRLVAVLPWPVTATAVAALAVVLSLAGKPAGRSIISYATVTGRYRRLNPDIVLRAYYAAGLGHPDRAGQQVAFGSTMARDPSGTGSQVVIDLPYGKTWEDVFKAKGAIASGLDVSINQVFLTRDPTSHRRHVLWVADRDPLAVPAGSTPLLDGKPRDIWTEAPFGLDERGRRVGLLLMWISVLVGAQPRKGKTFATRLLALFAALDPYVRLVVVDGKMSADWDKFRLVAHRYVCGVVPNSRDNNPIDHLLVVLREVKKHIEAVNDFLAKLPTSECPEGKITRDLSRKYEQLRVWLLVMEEFQNYFETDDQEVNKEIAALLSFIMAVGPSAGVIILSSSQKPSGVGAGDVGRLFTRYRDNHAVRFALKCGNRVVSEAILGGDAHSEGFDASALPSGKPYLGVGILYGASDDTVTVRTHLADHTDAERILLAARQHRQTAGTLSGHAAGETVARQARDILADAAAMFTGETGLSWERLAGRLAQRLPEHYADTTAGAVSSQLRNLKLPSVNVKEDGRVSKGVKLVDIRAAIQRRSR